MEILEQYTKGLNTYLVGYEKYLRKHIGFTERLDYLNRLFDIANEKETFPYSHFKIKVTYKDKDRKRHVYTSFIDTLETEKKVIDVFDVNYTYKDRMGKSCEINFSDVLQTNLKSIYDLFCLKSNDFEQCYKTKFMKPKNDAWDYWGGEVTSPEIDVEICGMFIADEFGTIVSAEDGTLLTYELPPEFDGGQYIVFGNCFGFIVSENDEFLVYE